MQFRPSAPLEYRGADEGSFQLSRWYELKMEDYVALQAHFYAVFGHDLSIYAVPATFSSRKKSSHQNFLLWIALSQMRQCWIDFQTLWKRTYLKGVNEYKWPHLYSPGTRMVVSFLPTIILFKSLFLLSLIFLLIFPVLGDPRVNQNPAFLALGIIFYRFHNLLAAKIQQQRPDWEDEDVFQAARRRVIATLQVLKKC